MGADDRAVFLITGPSAAGKTTVGRLLAGRFSLGVHLEGDFFRRSIVSGRHEVTPDLSEASLAQLMLRYRLSAAAVDTLFAEGYAVVWEDVIAPDLLSTCAALVRARPLHVVVLVARPDALSARDSARDATGYADWSVEQLASAFARPAPRLGLWVDTSEQTPEQTVDIVLAKSEPITGAAGA